MRISEVAKLPSFDRFMYWIVERHNIYLKRQKSLPRPWTDDEVLQKFWFTNPYRENDKVTRWFRENIREPLRDDTRVIFATIAFRWFNLPSTGEALLNYYGERSHPEDAYGLLELWSRDRAIKCLDYIRKQGVPIFTGAFVVNSSPGEGKLENITRRIDNVWKDRKSLIKFFVEPAERRGRLSLQEAHERLTEYDGMGGFMAYEVVCDLRYTKWLEDAPDKLTWCNPGPGAVRGLLRVLGRDFKKSNNNVSPPIPKDWALQTQKLLKEVNAKLPKHMPKFEMREIEMTLCEIDKYERMMRGDGRAKRNYNGLP